MIQTDIRDQIKVAMLAKDTVRLGVLRGLISAFTNELVAKKRKPDEALSDEDALQIIGRQVKQRKDSIEQFTKGGRTDLADAEKAELSVLEAMLPTQMTEDEIRNFINTKKTEINPDPSTKNQFMGGIMKELKGKADGALVKKIIDEVFA
ncbi:MAG: GatB/YqeY domain-containing protein [Minisyncoccia bacterium]